MEERSSSRSGHEPPEKTTFVTGRVFVSGLQRGPGRRARLRTFAGDCYQRYVLEAVFRRKALAPSGGRRIPLRLGGEPLIDERRGNGYITNTIRTSRYTVYNFLPKQIIFQFTRLSNFYFLCVGIPQVLGLGTTGNYTTILPLLFFVLLTILKEGYDDLRRHRLDKVENARVATVLRRTRSQPTDGLHRRWNLFRSAVLPKPKDEVPIESSRCDFQWAQIKWRDVNVGDVLRLSRDDDVPADIVLLHADGENNLAYVETMALDGETNLKSKQISSVLTKCQTIDGINECMAHLVVEDPNPDLYRFDGRVTVGNETLPLTASEVVYRGSTIRNTPCAIGIAINTGEECKIRMNANRHPKAKKPALEKVTNKIVLSLAAYVILLATGCSVGYFLWQRSTELTSWYLADASVSALEIIFGFIILFNNVIPLAMYVSLEIVKIGQMLLLNSDIEMYDEISDTPARCNTNTILENLGQIGYVFSDKTGTLTENVMKFRRLSIAGTSWLHDMDVHKQSAAVAGVEPSGEATHTGHVSPTRRDTGASVAGKGLALPIEEQANAIPEDDQVCEMGAMSPVSARNSQLFRRSSSHWRSTRRPDHEQPELTTEDLLEFIQLRPRSAVAKKAVEYIRTLALCHTCLPEVREGEVEFQASSPDELALVKAAQELGFLVVQRSSQALTVRISLGGEASIEEEYEILDVIEFSSKRKRMSIIVRCPDGRLWLICKGADSVLLPRLKMAHLAIQKANEVRKSAELDRELLRKSENQEPRNSFGGRASLNMPRSLGVAREKGSSGKRPTAIRSQSFEAGKLRRSGDLLRPIISRTLSVEVPRTKQPPTPTAQQPLPDKFAFLEESVMRDEGAIFSQCFKHLDDFATEGLRTLLFAHKFIPEAEYQAWKKLFLEATTSLDDRQERIEAVGDMVEQSLELVGASAIEDKLQRGVPETIDKLRRANIKIWMLTGDKRETAINIAHSARICKPGSDIFILDATKGDLEVQVLGIIEELQMQLETGSRPQLNHTVVVIDGQTLGIIEESATPLRNLFYNLIPTIDSVICCRASPAQKALLVRTIRHSPEGTRNTPGLTLAIGDGGNDLAMIAEAHVGVGISGREGLQAARVADYSISQFRFLARLLLIHGRWNYSRTAKYVLWTFWKEMFIYVGTIAYQIYNGYSGTSLYESWSLTVLNTMFTSLCVIVPGIFEQDLGPDVLTALPELYVYGQRGKGLNVPKFVGWMVAGVAEGVLVWFGCWAGYGVFSEFGDQGLFALGNLVFSACIMWTNWKLLILETHNKTAIILVSFFITVAGWWAWQAFLSGVYPLPSSPYDVRDGFISGFGRDPFWWLTLVTVLGVLAVIELGYKVLKRNLIVMGVWKYRWRWLSWKLWKKCARQRRLPRLHLDRHDADFAAEKWDLELWQEMEQDPTVKERLRLICRGDEGDVLDDRDDEFTTQRKNELVREV